MSRNGPYDPGGRDYLNDAPIDPPIHVYRLYDPNRDYRQDRMVETRAVQEGLTMFGQARRTPNNARLVAETDVDRDGSQSLAYASNLATRSEQVANHRSLPYPVQATPSDESSDSSDETAGNLEPLASRVDNQAMVAPRTETMRRRHDVRAEINQQQSTAHETILASVSNENDRQMESGYRPTPNQLATSTQVAASQGTEHQIHNPAILRASLRDYMGQEVFSKKWRKCKNSFQDISNVDANEFADQLICFINVANQIKCLECNHSCDINVKFEHKALCPVKHACTQITSFQDAQEADNNGPQGATGFTPTFVPPSVETLEISRANSDMRPVNQGTARHSEQHGGQHSTHPHSVHLQDTSQQQGESHVTSVKKRMSAAPEGATGYTPQAPERNGQARGKREKVKCHTGFDRRDIALKPPAVQQLASTLSRRSQENGHVSSARSGDTSAEKFLIEAGYDPRAIQEFKQSCGLQSMDSNALCEFLEYISKDSM